MKSIGSHIQPQFFLKGFLAKKIDEKHNDSVFVYKKGKSFKTDGTRKEKNPSLAGIGNNALVTNFYAFEREDGILDTETYKVRLQKEIESPTDNILRKLRAIQLSKNGSGSIIRES